MKMNDTEILDEVLDMLVTNEDADWIGNDPVTEFREIGRFIREYRENGLITKQCERARKKKIND